jgi:hypothetical protein
MENECTVMLVGEVRSFALNRRVYGDKRTINRSCTERNRMLVLEVNDVLNALFPRRQAYFVSIHFADGGSHLTQHIVHGRQRNVHVFRYLAVSRSVRTAQHQCSELLFGQDAPSDQFRTPANNELRVYNTTVVNDGSQGQADKPETNNRLQYAKPTPGPGL